MKQETKVAIEAEFARCDAIEAEFLDEAFALLAIVRGWTVDKAREEYEKRTLKTARAS